MVEIREEYYKQETESNVKGFWVDCKSEIKVSVMID